MIDREKVIAAIEPYCEGPDTQPATAADAAIAAVLEQLREPSKEMLAAASPFACDYHMADEVWTAMLAAAHAPTP